MLAHQPRDETRSFVATGLGPPLVSPRSAQGLRAPHRSTELGRPQTPAQSRCNHGRRHGAWWPPVGHKLAPAGSSQWPPTPEACCVRPPGLPLPAVERGVRQIATVQLRLDGRSVVGPHALDAQPHVLTTGARWGHRRAPRLAPFLRDGGARAGRRGHAHPGRGPESGPPPRT